MVDFIDSNWREHDGGADLVTKEFRRRVSNVRIAQHARNDAMPVKRFAIGSVCE